MKRIKLTKGYFAFISNKDQKKIKQHSWCVDHPERKPFYAVSRINNKIIYMHHFILNPDNRKMQIDHKDGDGLNNQRNNLRFCTQSQNNMNRSKGKNTSSKFKGVTWDKNRKKWIAKIKLNKKYYNLGRFKKEESAAGIYNKKAEQLFGKFARVNNVETKH